MNGAYANIGTHRCKAHHQEHARGISWAKKCILRLRGPANLAGTFFLTLHIAREYSLGLLRDRMARFESSLAQIFSCDYPAEVIAKLRTTANRKSA